MLTKMTLSTRGLLAAATCLTAAAATAAPIDQILDPVFSDGFNAWFNAAQTSQADIFLMGDSTVLRNGGWAHALNSGFANSSIGLAGSGLLSGFNQFEGEGGGYFQIARNNDFGAEPPVNGIREDTNNRRDPNDNPQFGLFDYRLPPVRANMMLGDALAGEVSPFGIATVNENNIFGPANRGVEIDGQGIASSGPLAFSVDLANPTATTATYRIARRNFESSGAVAPPVYVADAAGNTTFMLAAGEAFSFQTFVSDPLTGYNDSLSLSVESQHVGLDIGSFRVRNTDATGVTVTSWGYGGQTTEDFLSEQYLPLTKGFRQSTLNQIVAGGSGELLVVISQGFNDRSADDTPAEFVADIQALQAAIAADFVAAGNHADQLSFLAFGQYLTGNADPFDDTMAGYSLALRDAALVDDSLSFIDLRSLTADEDIQTIGNRLDFVEGMRLHFGNQTTAEFYGNALVTAIPEPTSAALLLGAGGLMLTRRRRA